MEQNLMNAGNIPATIRTQIWELKSGLSVKSLPVDNRIRYIRTKPKQIYSIDNTKTMDIEAMRVGGYMTVTSTTFASGNKTMQKIAERHLNRLQKRGVFAGKITKTRPVQYVFEKETLLECKREERAEDCSASEE